MAIDSFPIYDTLVNNIFGSIGLAIIGIAGVLILLMFVLKLSKVFIIYWLIFYFVVMGTLYLGALGMVFGFFFALIYFFIAIIRYAFRET